MYNDYRMPRVSFRGKEELAMPNGEVLRLLKMRSVEAEDRLAAQRSFRKASAA